MVKIAPSIAGRDDALHSLFGWRAAPTNERRFLETVAGIMGAHGVYFMTQTIPDFNDCPGRPSF
jgi:hypothetical protein